MDREPQILVLCVYCVLLNDIIVDTADLWMLIVSKSQIVQNRSLVLASIQICRACLFEA